MAIALDAVTEPNAATGTTFTWSHTCTGSDLALVALPRASSSSDVITGITYNGVAMTRMTNGYVDADAVDGVSLYGYVLAAPATGANDIVISFSSSMGSRNSARSYTGVDQTAPVNISASAATTGVTSWSQSITPTVDNCWVMSWARAALTLGAGANTTMDAHAQDTGLASFTSNSNPISPAASTTLNYTISASSAIGGIIYALQPPQPSALTATITGSGTLSVTFLRQYDATITGSGTLTAQFSAKQPFADYEVMVDWSGGTAFTGTSDNITAKVLSMEWRRGRQYASQLTSKAGAGVFIARLNNDGGTFSSFNAASPIFGQVAPGLRVRVRATQPGTNVLWNGFLDSLENTVSLQGNHVAVLRGVGPLEVINSREARIGMQTNRLTGSAVNDVLNDVGWGTAAADRSIDTGQTTMTRFWVERVSALYALRVIEDTEAGFIGESKTGQLLFEDRDHRLTGTHTTSQATFTDSATGTLVYVDIQQDDPLKLIYNQFEAQVRTFTTGTSTVLWTLAETGTASPAILAGGTLQYFASYPNPQSPTNAVAADSWTALTATADYNLNTQDDDAGTNFNAEVSITATSFGQVQLITISNTGTRTGFLTKLRAQGVPVLVSDPAIVSVSDGTSQTKYGKRTYPNPGMFIPTTSEADSWARYSLGVYKDPQPIIHMRINANRSGDMMEQALTRDISDRITVIGTTNSDLGMTQDFFIEAEHHVVTPGNIHFVTWDCSPATAFGGVWMMGTSELGTSSRLGY